MTEKASILQVEGAEKLSRELGHFLLNSSGKIECNLEITRIGAVDLRESEGNSDFSVYGTLSNGNRISIYGSMSNERDRDWLRVRVGDKVIFGYTHTKHSIYTPERTSSGGGGEPLEYDTYQNCVLLNVIKGSARQTFSQLAGEEEMELKKPKSKSGAQRNQFDEDDKPNEDANASKTPPSSAL